MPKHAQPSKTLKRITTSIRLTPEEAEEWTDELVREFLLG